MSKPYPGHIKLSKHIRAHGTPRDQVSSQLRRHRVTQTGTRISKHIKKHA